MATSGVYRVKAVGAAVEFAHVVHAGGTTEDVTRAFYELQGYQPPFDQLPTKDEYEKAKNADRT